MTVIITDVMTLLRKVIAMPLDMPLLRVGISMPHSMPHLRVGISMPPDMSHLRVCITMPPDMPSSAGGHCHAPVCGLTGRATSLWKLKDLKVQYLVMGEWFKNNCL